MIMNLSQLLIEEPFKWQRLMGVSLRSKRIKGKRPQRRRLLFQRLWMTSALLLIVYSLHFCSNRNRKESKRLLRLHIDSSKI